MATRKDFKKQLADREPPRPRPGIVPVDPVELTGVERSARPEQKRSIAEYTKGAEVENAALSMPTDPRSLKVKGEVPMKVGWHMYPTRHRQVVYEAFVLDMKPWEVNEIALREYFERRYGSNLAADNGPS